MTKPAATGPDGGADAEAATSFDRSVSTAFAVGWEVASLYGSASSDGERRAEEGDDLPELDALSDRERTALAVDQIDSSLRKIGGRLEAGAVAEKRIGALREALSATPGDQKAVRQGVEELHVEVLLVLTAADFRLGKAYSLGHALADTCLRAEDRPSLHRAFGRRLVSVKNSLADLASSLPPHASRAVGLSLRTWEAWAADPRLDGEPLDWATHGAGVQGALRRQGELWHDLLAAEKRGEDMLDTSHYLRAANALVVVMTSTVWRFLRPLRMPLAVMATLLGGGIALILLTGSVGRVFGTIAVVAGALGITGAGIRARLGKVAMQLETRLWGAELDLAVAEAILIGPTGWGASVAGISAPASGAPPKEAANIETLRKFRQGVEEKQDKKIRALLAPAAEFIVGEEAKRGRDAVTEWLLQGPESTRILSEPRRVEAAGPGVLVTCVDSGADVWRVQEGKVRRWQSFADGDRARAAALAIEGDEVGASKRTG